MELNIQMIKRDNAAVKFMSSLGDVCFGKISYFAQYKFSSTW